MLKSARAKDKEGTECPLMQHLARRCQTELSNAMRSLRLLRIQELSVCYARRIEKLVRDHSATVERNSLLTWYDNLADKYGNTLRDLEAERDHRHWSPWQVPQGAGLWMSWRERATSRGVMSRDKSKDRMP